MGASLFAYPEIADLCERCSAAACVDLHHLLVDASDEELKQTGNAQPALVFMGVALSRLLAHRGILAAAVAGHSVGEYAALCVAGALRPEDAVRAVRERGRAMAQAAPSGTSSMLAVLGLPESNLEAALIGIPSVWPANYNTPTQTVVGGTMAGLQRAAERLRQAGARRLVPLNVAAAFHTPLVEQAGTSLRGLLEAIEWRAPDIPIVANVSAKPYEDPSSIPAALERQVSSPVRWGDSVLCLSRLGCETFYELGPKRALTGMLQELVPDASARPISSPEAAEEVH